MRQFIFCTCDLGGSLVMPVDLHDDSEEPIDGHPLSTSSSLITQLQQLDPERWRVFVRLYTPLLQYWIRRHSVPRSAQEDLLQEILVSISAGIQKFSPREVNGTFRGWLRTMVQRRAADYRRSLSVQVSTTAIDLLTIPANTVEAEDVQAEQQAFEELRIRAMELARQSCTENSWQMFWQTVVDGRPTADVATDYGVSTAAVRMARGRVLNLLREFLVDDVTMPGT